MESSGVIPRAGRRAETAINIDVTKARILMPPPRPSTEDIVMTDGPALLGKHCHEESSEHHSQLAKHPSSPRSITAHPSTPTTPVEPPSPVPTEIATDLPIVELTPEEHMLGLHAAGIKVRDFAYEVLPNSCKAPEVSDPVPSLITAEWQGRSPSAALAFQSVVPHLSGDHTALSDAIRWVHVPFESS